MVDKGFKILNKGGNKLNKLREIIYPKWCFGCGKAGSYLCASCRIRKIRHIYEPVCPVCQTTVSGCFVHQDCQEYTYLDGVISVGRYEGLLKKLILAAKYQYYFAVLEELAELLRLKLREFESLAADAVITYVPSSPERKRWRGFNQSEMLANFLAGEEVHKVLDKKAGAAAQATLNRYERLQNLQGSFFISAKSPSVLAKVRKVLIIDDVFTTGATAENCSKEIKRNNPDVNVYMLTVARS